MKIIKKSQMGTTLLFSSISDKKVERLIRACGIFPYIVLPSEGLALIGRPKKSPGGIDFVPRKKKKLKADVNRFCLLIEAGKQ